MPPRRHKSQRSQMTELFRQESGLRSPPSAAQRVYETEEIFLGILSHLPNEDIPDICTVGRIALRLCYDVLGRRVAFDCRKVEDTARIARKETRSCHQIVLEAKLAAVRTISVRSSLKGTPLLSHPSAEKSSMQFSPAQLKGLRQSCPNLRYIHFHSDDTSPVHMVDTWGIDLSRGQVYIDEVKLVKHEESLEDDLGSKVDHLAKIWTGLAVEHSINLLLDYSGDSLLASCSQMWLNSIASELRVRKLSFIVHHGQPLQTGVQAAIRLLEIRGSIGQYFDEIVMAGHIQPDEGRELLEACAGCCRNIVFRHSEQRIDPTLIPPAGTTLRYAGLAEQRDAFFPLGRRHRSDAIDTTSAPEVEIGWLSQNVLEIERSPRPTLPGQYLTSLDIRGERRYRPKGPAYGELLEFEHLATVTDIVRKQLPALKRLRIDISASSSKSRSSSWKAPPHSWPGTVDHVDIALIGMPALGQDHRSQCARLPYFEMARTLAALCSDGGAFEIRQWISNKSDKQVGRDSGMRQSDLQAVVQWLQNLNPRRQDVMRKLDFTAYGLRPLRAAPFDWRSVTFDEHDRIIPLEYGAAVQHVRKICTDAGLSTGTRKRHADWALSELRSMLKVGSGESR